MGREGDLLGARLELFVGALVARRPDLPLAVDLDVRVLVERGAADVDAELELEDEVHQGPRALRRVGTRDVDLGLADAVGTEELLATHRRTEELDDGVATLDGPG